MSKLLIKTEIKRAKGMLYFCGTDKESGCITVNEAVMARGRKKKSKK
jgi:hypothetical protein